jgi:hypothetical protein
VFGKRLIQELSRHPTNQWSPSESVNMMNVIATLTLAKWAFHIIVQESDEEEYQLEKYFDTSMSTYEDNTTPKVAEYFRLRYYTLPTRQEDVPTSNTCKELIAEELPNIYQKYRVGVCTFW